VRGSRHQRRFSCASIRAMSRPTALTRRESDST
jgi:hypothetical protein